LWARSCAALFGSRAARAASTGRAVRLAMKGAAPQKVRHRIWPTRCTGRITDWKGSFGWICPDMAINHPQAKMHKGQVYLSQADVEAEISGIGAHVSFFVYADGTGLGAMSCRPSAYAAHAPMMPIRKPALVAKESFGVPPGRKQRVGTTKVTGEIKAWKGGFGWITPDQPVKHPLFRGQIYVKSSDVVGGQPLEAGTRVEFHVYIDSQGVGAEECELSFSEKPTSTPVLLATRPAAQKAEPGPAPGPSNDPGPRERLTEVPTTGELLDWKGTFGWIKPHDPVDHPQAVKRNGNIYLSKKDLQGETSPTLGQLLQFHVFVDNSGLGAEECTPF